MKYKTPKYDSPIQKDYRPYYHIHTSSEEGNFELFDGKSFDGKVEIFTDTTKIKWNSSINTISVAIPFWTYGGWIERDDIKSCNAWKIWTDELKL